MVLGVKICQGKSGIPVFWSFLLPLFLLFVGAAWNASVEHADLVTPISVVFFSPKVPVGIKMFLSRRHSSRYGVNILFHHKNICCGYSLEAPHWGASNEYPQHMILLRNKKNRKNFFEVQVAPAYLNTKTRRVRVVTLVYLFVLRFYGPVNPMGSCRARSVYLTTCLLGRLSPLSS